jgi:hypothetical protein
LKVEWVVNPPSTPLVSVRRNVGVRSVVVKARCMMPPSRNDPVTLTASVP